MKDTFTDFIEAPKVKGHDDNTESVDDRPEGKDFSESTEDGESTTESPKDVQQEQISTLEEGIRLATINKNSAETNLQRWRETKTTEPSHFAYKLPQIQNQISSADHRISSSKLDIELITESPSSPELGDGVIKKFITNQMLEQKTSSLRNTVSSFATKEADFKSKEERNRAATEKLQSELESIDADIASGTGDTEDLKRIRRGLYAEIDTITDRYSVLMAEKKGIDTSKEVSIKAQAEIDRITAEGVDEDSIPKIIQEDPDFEACLKNASTCSSEDDEIFKKKTGYDPMKNAYNLFKDRFPQKSLYYQRLQALSEPAEKRSTTPNKERESGVVSIAETIIRIKNELLKGDIKSKVESEQLVSESIIDTKHFFDIEPERVMADAFEYVDTADVVGRPNASEYTNGWAHEYDERTGRIQEIVTQINTPENETGIENIFHTEDPANRIKLAQYDGPAGPIYTLFDGTHRVAGIKASGLKEFPAELYRTKYPFEKESSDVEEISNWKDKIQRGFIDGSIDEIETASGKRFILKIRNEVVPWIRARNSNDIFKINQIYEKRYPGSLEKVGFPKETLFDISALWAFMDGAFDAWKTAQAKQ